MMMRRTRRGGVLVAVASSMAALPGPGTGQAICSAPHSSPTLAQSGAIETMPPGAGWIQLSLVGQRASEGFNPRGERQDFLGVSAFETRSAYLTAGYGVLDGLEVWGQLPVHRLTASGSAGRSEGSGVGDVRAALRASPRLLGLDAPLALRAGVKLPGSDFPVDPRLLPLTEGQRDVEVSLESGWAHREAPVYVVAWVGYRWRGPNRSAGFEPGDERFAHVALGGQAGPVLVELGIDGLWGLAPIEQGLELESSRRRLLQLLPTVGTEVGAGRLEATVPIPLSGRNVPATIGVSVGYRLRWGGP